MAGLSSGWDRLLVRGAIEHARFSIFYFKGDRLLGADTVNHPSEHMQVRKLLAAGVSFADAPLEDPGFDLKTLIQPATAGKPSPARPVPAPTTSRPT
jgi:3-phenylpropionate/trans-cinnamate dioxygenase ferredoxin reductase subunit